MARRVFFSFHYEGDVLRVGQIRNSGLTKIGIESAGFIDHAEWESLKQRGKAAIQKWIDEQLQGSSVTVVLIGPETAEREWIEYEIKESYKRGNGLLGIYIHNVKDLKGETARKGKNPITNCRIRHIKTYDWVRDEGYGNFSQWVENAYKQAEQRKAKEKQQREDAKPLITDAVLGFAMLIGVVIVGIAGLVALFGGLNKNNDNDQRYLN